MPSPVVTVTDLPPSVVGVGGSNVIVWSSTTVKLPAPSTVGPTSSEVAPEKLSPLTVTVTGSSASTLVGEMLVVTGGAAAGAPTKTSRRTSRHSTR